MIPWINIETIGVTRAAIPLLAIPILSLQSWHCMAMCGSQFSLKNRHEKNNFLLGKLISYSLPAAFCGYIGESLLKLSEIKIFGIVIFFVYLFFTILLILAWFASKSFDRPYIFKLRILRILPQSAFIQGLSSIAIPCGILYQMLNLAVLSKSSVGGLLIGSSQASISAISLWFSSQAIQKVFLKFDKFKPVLRILLILVIAYSLYSFASIIFNEQGEIDQQKLLCI